MRGSNMRKELCRVCLLVFLVLVSWQEGKREAFYTLRPTLTTPLQLRSLNGEKSIQRLQSNYVTSYFALGFVLIFLDVLLT
jgi:hypothetical protein